MSQPFRLSEGGAIDRNRVLQFTFNGRVLQGHPGDTAASALLANGVRLVGRSFKYHRPRGIMALGSDEPNALLRVVQGGEERPNLPATSIELQDALELRSQHHWPTLGFDVGRVNDLTSALLPAGFYYKTFMWPAWAWRYYERAIRQAAGLGRAPSRTPWVDGEKRHAQIDVLVIGGGPAGLAAACAASEAGASVLLADAADALGGSILHEAAGGEVDGGWIEACRVALAAAGATVLSRTVAVGYYDQDLLTLVQRPAGGVGAECLWKVRAQRVIFATGAHERPLVFGGNDRPGVMLAAAVRGYLHRFGVLCGRRAVVVTDNDSAYATALDLAGAGAAVAAIIDLRAEPGAMAERARRAGITVLAGCAITRTNGGAAVKSIGWASLTDRDVRGRLVCDLVAMSGGWSPAVHLFSQARGRLRYDESRAAFLPTVPGGANRSVGSCNGSLVTTDCIAEGRVAGQAAAAELGKAERMSPSTLPVSEEATCLEPGLEARWHGKGKRFVDFQNDVTADDIALAATEGYRSVEHLKRYTTLGMGTDQGKLSNVNGLAILARKLAKPIGAVGTTTFRPPYIPVRVATMVGRDAGDLAHPPRHLPSHEWHVARGASFGPPGPWLRPRAYPVTGESESQAIRREVLAVRGAVGAIDVSPLGKIEVHGPDAVALLERLYVNGFTKLAPGRCRYGIMLRSDGMVFDDGVVMRLGSTHFMLSTSTANALAVLEHIEVQLRTELASLRVFVTGVTEQWSSIALAGPNARDVLEALEPEFDISREVFVHMSVRSGNVAGLPARVCRMSFSGELAYELHVAADQGEQLWEAVVAAGAPWNLVPYGTEAMGVLRIEKGHFVIGREANGRTTPGDLGLDGLVARQKPGVGKRSLSLPALTQAGRRQLVGLLPVESDGRIPAGAHVVAAAHLLPQPSLGFVTSLCFSPNLDRWIALALVKDGRDHIGKTLHAVSPVTSEIVAVRLCSPVFVDPPGERVNG